MVARRAAALAGFLLAALLGTTASAFAQESADGSGIFRTADRCMACHNGLVAPSGEDVSIGTDWRASMMANSARDPYWRAAVRRETIDHPEARGAIENECSICHMPMANVLAGLAERSAKVFGSDHPALAADGVSCTVCHQIRDERLGTRESFVGGFVVDTTRTPGPRRIFGPYWVDDGRMRIMRSATGFAPDEAVHLQKSEVCATCHTLYTHALGPGGETVGELPEQVPYLEWLHSDYRYEKSCQSCHMQTVADSVAISSVMGEPRAAFSRHAFRGGNAFMLGILNRHRDELGVEATPGELDAAIRRTVDHLRAHSATLEIQGERGDDGRLAIEVAIANRAGHKLPTAYPSRRAWIHLTVLDAAGRTLFESGALEPSGRIVGNDNDADPDRFEPHREEISRGDEVQVYEAILAGPDGEVTTGLLTAVEYVKDNRILPKGFDKAAAGPDIAVQGRAAEDPDFAGGGDRVRYRVDPGDAAGPFRVEAELLYQPIAYRWAHNLRPYTAPEIDRFLFFYEGMADVSATRLVRSEATIE